MVRVRGVEPLFRPWEGRILAVIRHPHGMILLAGAADYAVWQLRRLFEASFCVSSLLTNRSHCDSVQSRQCQDFYTNLSDKYKNLGATCRDRTGDLLVTNEVLYQLS